MIGDQQYDNFTGLYRLNAIDQTELDFIKKECGILIPISVCSEFYISGSYCMKRIIEDVLETEEKVNATLRQAREKAAEIRRSAENEVSEKTNEAKKNAREIVQTAVEDAKREGERIRAEKLKQVDAEKDALLSGSSPKDDEIDGLINEICNVITTTEKGGNSNS